jgi:serine/threonine protein kinase
VQRDLLRRNGPTGDGWKGFPVRGTFSQGVAWIAWILARTLDYAHGMQTFHRDVKPGNVLITLHHGPQLLDFNLAESPHSAQHAQSAMLGGTVPYMAPEQIEAFLNPDLWGKVGARADIYSLGLVIRELLTGQAPDLPNEKLPSDRAMRELLDRRAGLATDVRRFNPEIPYALEAIVQRCLCLDPEERYPDAQALADDLERFLSRKALRHAINPSHRERLSNWVSRNHRSMVGTSLTIALGIVLGYFASPLVKESMKEPKPPLPGLPTFHRVVRKVHENQPTEALEPLLDLKRDYPDDPLLGLYLFLVHASRAHLVEDEVQISFRRNLNVPATRALLSDWTRNNPALAKNLQELARSLLEKIQDYDRRVNTLKASRSEIPEGPADRESKKRYYETMLEVLRLALEVDPTSEGIRELMATAELALGNYSLAHLRLTELITAVRGRQDPREGDKLVDWTTQRGRVAIRWSADLRAGGPDPARRQQAIGLLKEAAKDLGNCEAVVMGIAKVADGWKDQQIVHYYLWIRAETCLVLGEIEREQGQDREASINFQNAKKAIDWLDAFARLQAIRLPARFQDFRTRARDGLLRLPAKTAPTKGPASASRASRADVLPAPTLGRG